MIDAQVQIQDETQDTQQTVLVISVINCTISNIITRFVDHKVNTPGRNHSELKMQLMYMCPCTHIPTLCHILSFLR